MSDDPRVYSDEEFGLILRKATELATREELPVPLSAGLTLIEIKAAAAQAGIDPALIERAARTLADSGTASVPEQLIGGPLRHEYGLRFPIMLDENSAARLLSAVRVRAGMAGGRDVGHSSAMGMIWHDGGDTEALRITAHPEEDGTTVSIVLDRRGTFAVVAMSSGMVMFLAGLFAVFGLYPEAPALGLGGFLVGIGGTLAGARGYWASSTRKVCNRISFVMDVIGQALSEPENQTFKLRSVGDGAVAPQHEASDSSDAKPTGA